MSFAVFVVVAAVVPSSSSYEVVPLVVLLSMALDVAASYQLINFFLEEEFPWGVFVAALRCFC